MPTALFLSPHLDDVAFSCGGLLAQLGDAGWRTVMATAFTATVLPATGFALACQLDKGLAPEVDYMALRREEDRAAAAILGVSDLRWLDLPEAPHRGYGSAPELFGAVLANDEIWRPLATEISLLIDELQPSLVLAPQGLGNHVDHRQMICAVQQVSPLHLAFYRDTPYAIRNPTAVPYVNEPCMRDCVVGIADGLERRSLHPALMAARSASSLAVPLRLRQRWASSPCVRAMVVRRNVSLRFPMLPWIRCRAAIGRPYCRG
jgi:LmbE family N-acetylglucosaminyl deacetylase